jgi:xanthine/uracil/vitamin C permease (AzgA family)
MADDAPAKIYSDQRTVTIHLGDSGDGFTLPFKEKWRAPDATAAVVGLLVTAGLVTAHLDSGYALRILVVGIALTVTAVWLLSKLPSTRPSLSTRAVWMWANTRPRVVSSHPPKPHPPKP